VVRLTPRPLYPQRKSPFAIEYDDKIEEGGLGWHVACMGGKKDAYMAKATIAEGKRPLGIPKRRSKYGINVGLRKIGWETSA
jgi:hypothetical protein